MKNEDVFYMDPNKHDPKFIEAIRAVVNYSDLYEEIKAWKNIPIKNGAIQILNYDNFAAQIIYGMCVQMYGDWGTSVYTGWINESNKDMFYAFIDVITWEDD